MTETPERGFPAEEFESRISRLQKMMSSSDLAALVLTTAPDIYYTTGFLTRFFESPTRPWFVVIPQEGKPVAVIPRIGEEVMARTWIDDIRTWQSPDLEDDGVSLLADTLTEIAVNGKIAMPDGHETHIRMPHADLKRLEAKIAPATLTGDHGIMRAMRMVKTPAEIAKIRHACNIADRAFSRLGEIISAGNPLDQVFRRFQMLCLEEGADWVQYLAGGAGPDGYSDVISPASSKPLETGDIVMLDTGLVWDGYFCDFDRNVAVVKTDNAMRSAHARLIEATQAGFDAAKPGATAADLFHAMDKVLTGGNGDNSNGRLGHGLGINLTEWPSLIPQDHTMLEPGMVLTLEPGIATRNGMMMVHEENIVIGTTGAEWLSSPQQSELPVLGN